MVGDKIVVVGGQADGKLVPRPRFSMARVRRTWLRFRRLVSILVRRLMGVMFLRSGAGTVSGQERGCVERYDPASDSWTELEAMSTATGSVGAGYAGGRVVAVGGELDQRF